MKVNIGNYPKNGGDRKVKIEITRSDTYSLDHTLALIIAPALREFKKIDVGIWGSLLPENWTELSKRQRNVAERKAIKERDRILDKMIRAFELIIDDCATFDKKVDAEIQEGLDLFAEYYRGLWW